MAGNKKLYFCRPIGEMAERFNAAVLKTVVLHGTGGSNPSLSAFTTSKEMQTTENQVFTVVFVFRDMQ